MINKSLAVCSYVVGILFPMYQQACYIVQPRHAYRVSLYGSGHVYCAFLLPFDCTTLSGSLANALCMLLFMELDFLYIVLPHCSLKYSQLFQCYFELLSVSGAYILSRLSFARSQYNTIDNNCGSCRDHLLFVVFVTTAKQSVQVLFVILPIWLGSLVT